MAHDAVVIPGIVKNGLVVPQGKVPLPEGASSPLASCCRNVAPVVRGIRRLGTRGRRSLGHDRPVGTGGAAVKVGDIHWIELPATDGHEQGGRCPAVIVQDETFAGQLPVVLAIPLTTATSTLALWERCSFSRTVKMACASPP